MSTATLKLLFNILALAASIALALVLVMPGVSEDGHFRAMAEGRLIAEQGGFPALDPFNYSLPVSAAFDKDGWLFSLTAFSLQSFASMKALGLLRSALLMGSFLFLVAAGFRRQARPFSTVLCSLWAIFAVLPQAEFSSSLTGFFFFSAALYVMEGDFWRAFFARWIWLPVLMVLWINFQGAALLFPAFAWIWALSEKNSNSDQAPQFPGIALISTLGVLSACAFMHPALWRVLAFARPGPMATPFEGASFESSKAALGLLGVCGLGLFTSATLPQGRPHARRDFLLFVGLALVSMLWKSALPFACLLAAPMAAARADILVDALPSPLRHGRWVLKVAALAWALFFLPQWLAASARGLPPKPKPKETLLFFKEELLSGNIYNENDWAGGLIWELSPAIKVFSDGRKGNAGDYVRVLNAQEGWEKILDRYATDFAWLKINSPLSKAMARSAAWQPLDFDNASVLYTRITPQRAQLIKTWAPRGLRPGDLDEPFESSRLPQVEADLESRRLKRPNSGVLHYFEARLQLEKGRDALARQWLEQGIKADAAYAPNYRLLADLRYKMGDKKAAQVFYERAAALGGL